MKKVLNVSKRTYKHTVVDGDKMVQYTVEPNQCVSVPDEVADLWLRSPEIQEVEKGSEEKDAEIARLKKELEKAKAGEDAELEALREEAKNLGIKGFATSKAETLKAKIEQAKKDAAEKEKTTEEEKTEETKTEEITETVSEVVA